MNFCEIEYRELTHNWNMTQLQSHDYYEIYCLLEGERRIFLGDKIFTLQKKTLVVIPPFCMHKTEGGPYKRMNIYISPNLLDTDEKATLDACSKMIAFRLNDNQDLIFALLKSVSLNQKKAVKTKYELSLIKTFLYFLSVSKIQSVPQVFSPVTIQKDDVLVTELTAYINEHYSEKLTLNSLAKLFYISKNSLSRRFFNVMNISVMEYCNIVRFNAAKNLLLTTKKSVMEISELCGFSSANYFSLIFKKQIGLSPLNYRKKR